MDNKGTKIFINKITQVPITYLSDPISSFVFVELSAGPINAKTPRQTK